MARPRSVPEEVALERALLLFWRRGFDRTSISDLSAAIGVGPSSIYNAFGSKEELYQRALTHYLQTHLEFAGALLADDSQTDPVEFVRAFLGGLAKLYTSKGLPPGCAIFQSAGLSSPAEARSCAITHEINQGILGAVRHRIEACASAGAALAAPPKTLAHFIVGTSRGLSQLACDGVRRSDLMKVVEHAARSCAAV